MNYIENFSPEQIDKQCEYLWGAVLSALYKKEQNDPTTNDYLQTTINIISGSSKLFNNSPKIVSICALLETACNNDEQFRKCILDSMGLIDEIRQEWSVAHV